MSRIYEIIKSSVGVFSTPKPVGVLAQRTDAGFMSIVSVAGEIYIRFILFFTFFHLPIFSFYHLSLCVVFSTVLDDVEDAILNDLCTLYIVPLYVVHACSG